MDLDPGCNSQRSMKADPWQRIKYLAYRIAEDPTNIDGTKYERAALLFDVAEFFAKEDQVSVFLA